MSAHRQTLPSRRPNVTETFKWQDTRLTLTVGFDDAGAAREVFVDGWKAGHAFKSLIDDAGVIISLALQHGVSAQRLYSTLRRPPYEPEIWRGEGAAENTVASLLGWIVLHVARIEQDVLAGETAA